MASTDALQNARARDKRPLRELFEPIKLWQTRILCLFPGQAAADDDEGESSSRDNLQANLLVVNLHTLEGVTVETTGQVIGYNALSYVWGPRDTSRTLICLGEPDQVNQVGFAWIERIAKWRKRVPNADEDGRLEVCIQDFVTHIRDRPEALANFYGCSWLGRTWIRQEIYGARQLIVQSGTSTASWNDFIYPVTIVLAMREKFPNEDACSWIARTSTGGLLEEASKNAHIPPELSAKPPREILEVLHRARRFGVSDQRDTFYAVLGMCDIPVYTIDSMERPRNAVLVDYRKSLAEVYQDAFLYILGMGNITSSLANLWHFYRRSPLHSTDDLPTWAIDWRSGVLDNTYDTCRSSPDRAWMPLSSDEDSDSSKWGQWHFPQPLLTDPRIIDLKARAINYVAYVSDYTYAGEDFLDDEQMHSFAMGASGLTIDAQHIRKQRKSALFHDVPTQMTRFNPAQDCWRLGLLGVGNDSQVCLLPANAQKGDIVVAITPDLLPMLLRPSHDGATVVGALCQPDGPDEPVCIIDAPPSDDDDDPKTSTLMSRILRTSLGKRFLCRLLFLLSMFCLCAPALVVATRDNVLCHVSDLYGDPPISIGECFRRAQAATYARRTQALIPASLFTLVTEALVSIQCHETYRNFELLVCNDLYDRRTSSQWLQDDAMVLEIIRLFTIISRVSFMSFISCTIFRFPPHAALLLLAFSHLLFFTAEISTRLILEYHRFALDITRSLRRRDVFAYLDKAIEHLGEEYEFVGPVLARQKRVSFNFTSDIDESFIMFKSVEDMEGSIPWGFPWLVKRVQRSRGVEGDVSREDLGFLWDDIVGERNWGRVWKRPIQGFKLK